MPLDLHFLSFLSEVELLARLDVMADSFFEIFIVDDPVAISVHCLVQHLELALVEDDAPLVESVLQLLRSDLAVFALVDHGEALFNAFPFLAHFGEDHLDDITGHDCWLSLALRSSLPSEDFLRILHTVMPEVESFARF